LRRHFQFGANPICPPIIVALLGLTHSTVSGRDRQYIDMVRVWGHFHGAGIGSNGFTLDQ
jgi:hypothetical protein